MLQISFSVDDFGRDFKGEVVWASVSLRAKLQSRQSEVREIRPCLILRFCTVPKFSSDPYFQRKMKITAKKFFQLLKGVGKKRSTNLVGKKKPFLLPFFHKLSRFSLKSEKPSKKSQNELQKSDCGHPFRVTLRKKKVL